MPESRARETRRRDDQPDLFGPVVLTSRPDVVVPVAPAAPAAPVLRPGVTPPVTSRLRPPMTTPPSAATRPRTPDPAPAPLPSWSTGDVPVARSPTPPAVDHEDVFFETPPPPSRHVDRPRMSAVVRPPPPAPPAERTAADVPLLPDQVQMEARIRKVILKKDDGFSLVLASSGKDEFTFTTTFPMTCGPGDRAVLRGKWEDWKGRRTFRATSVLPAVPRDTAGIVSWIKSLGLTGVGKVTAEKVGRHFGPRLKSVISDPSVLVEAGVPMAKAKAIAEAWSGNTGQGELMSFLAGFGLGPATITKIMRRYGAYARNKIDENPWELAETIEGVGFATSDEIGLKYGHLRTSPLRIRAAFRFTLKDAERDGHCGLPVEELVEKAARRAGLRPDEVRPQLSAALDGDGATLDRVTGLAYPHSLARAETELAAHLHSLADPDHGVDPVLARKALGVAESELGITLDDSQRDAALAALTNPVCIVTGGPGTGKSTTLKVVLRALTSLGRKVVQAAPTGRAAKRLNDVTGYDASTCHRLLQFEGERGGFAFDADQPFDEDWFIVDEFSMVDTKLAHSYVQAIRKGSGLTIVGDVDQLPSVGAGQVLRDLIESGTVPTARLKVVHRQAGDSYIVEAAHRINAGEHPLPSGSPKVTGFRVDRVDDEEALLRRVVHLVTVSLPAAGYDKDVQVLAAMRKGPVGVDRLNEAIKAAVNPAKDDGRSVTFGNRTFTEGDRVMQSRNDYVKEVFNGEVGTVWRVGTVKDKDGKDQPSFTVDYGGTKATYTRRDCDEVEAAYATSVHKSQGCEFRVVVFVCPRGHSRMLTRNLFYTAVTRAKKGCIVAGDEQAVTKAVRTVDTDRRHTGLAKRLGRLAAASEHLERGGGRFPSPAPGFVEFDDD